MTTLARLNGVAQRTHELEGAPAAIHPWPLAERPGFLVRRLHQIHVGLFMEACAAFDITPLQYSVMSALAEQGTADQTTLATAVVLDRTTTTGIIKRLHARGLVTRAKSERDRRAQVCSLNPTGRALLLKMEAAVRHAHQDTVAPLDAAEQKILIALLRRIVTAHRSQPGEASVMI